MSARSHNENADTIAITHGHMMFAVGVVKNFYQKMNRRLRVEEINNGRVESRTPDMNQHMLQLCPAQQKGGEMRPVKYMTENALRKELSELNAKIREGEATFEEATRAIEIRVALRAFKTW